MPGPSYELELIDNCSDLSSWTDGSSGDCTVEESTDFVKFGTKSLKFTAPDDTAGSNCILTKDIAHSFKQDDRLGVLYYIPVRHPSVTNGAVAQGADGSAYGGTNKWQSTMFAEAQGWWFNPLSFADTTTGAGSPTIALDYASMRFRLNGHANGVTKQYYLDSIFRYRSRPHVIFTFDDGHITSYDEGHSYANAAGVPLTHFVMPSQLNGTNASFYRTAQALEMAAAGDEIGAHAVGTRAWEVDPNDIVTDVDSIRQITGLPIHHGAYPNGGYGETDGNFAAVQAKCEEAGLLSCRTVKVRHIFPGAFSPYVLPIGCSLESGTSLADAKGVVDKAIKHGLTAIILGHKLDATADSEQWAISDWQDLIDYVALKRKQGLIEAKTISQWWAGDSRASISGARAT